MMFLVVIPTLADNLKNVYLTAWLIRNKLSLSVRKTELLILCSKYVGLTMRTCINVHINGTKLIRVKNVNISVL